MADAAVTGVVPTAGRFCSSFTFALRSSCYYGDRRRQAKGCQRGGQRAATLRIAEQRIAQLLLLRSVELGSVHGEIEGAHGALAFGVDQRDFDVASC